MVVGNLVALTQRSLKRMLAYSSIAHAGYLLVGGLAGHAAPAPARCCSICSPTALTTLASFGFLAVLGRGGERDVTLDDIAGLGRHAARASPSASASACSRCSGFPGTFGFIGKWYIITAVVARGAIHPAGHPGADQRDLGAATTCR